MSENRIEQIHDMVTQLMHIVGNTNTAVEKLRKGQTRLQFDVTELKTNQQRLDKNQQILLKNQQKHLKKIWLNLHKKQIITSKTLTKKWTMFF